MKSFRHLYGPVPSRRLGRSLGIDLVPHKVCTFDCVYCQIGKTTHKSLVRREYVPVKEILEEVKTFLQNGNASVDFLSLGGSGEPTLHSKIRSIIAGMKELTPIPVAVLTNGFLLFRKRVRQDLLRADVVLPSLDAASQVVFERINRPPEDCSINKIIEGMVEFRKIYKGQIWLEILFCKGINDTEDELRRMKEAVEKIQPDLIHLNTVVRPPSEKWALALSREELEKIKAFFGEKAEIISEFDRRLLPVDMQELTEKVLTILRRRPLSSADLSKWMQIPESELQKYLLPLVKEGKVQLRSFGASTYYEVAPKDPSASE